MSHSRESREGVPHDASQEGVCPLFAGFFDLERDHRRILEHLGLRRLPHRLHNMRRRLPLYAQPVSLVHCSSRKKVYAREV